MRRFDDPSVICPFDKNHKMPSARLPWHIVRCNAHKSRQEQGLPIYHCRHNYSHIYLEKEELVAHESECSFGKKEVKEVADLFFNCEKQKCWLDDVKEDLLSTNEEIPAVSQLVPDTQDTSASAPGWGSEFKVNAAEAEKVKAEAQEDAAEWVMSTESIDVFREILVGFLFAIMIAVLTVILVEIYVVSSHGLHQSCSVKKFYAYLFNRDDQLALIF